MTINQISIFLENKYGKLSDIFALLTGQDIRIIAGTIADTSEYGILRLIVSEPQRAYKTLKDNNVSCSLVEVFALTTTSNVCAFTQEVRSFTDAGLSIEYMYCFSMKEKSILILRTNNQESTRDVIRCNSLEYITESGLINL